MTRAAPTPPSASARVLLVGGGHAMLPALQRAPRWIKDGAAVTLVSDCRYFYYSGMVPEYLGGVYAQEDVRIDLARWCQRGGVRFVENAAVRLDPSDKFLVTSGGMHLAYDVAAFDIGARNPDETGEAIHTKPLHRIERLEARVQETLAERIGCLHLVIAGGAAAGVEIALNLTARFAAQGRAGGLRLTLVEPAPHLLSGFPLGARAYAEAVLRRRGADLRLKAHVRETRADCVLLDSGERLSADEVLWATGSVGPGLFAEAGLPCDERGFVRVRPSLQCPGHPFLFAAGDSAAVAGHEHLARVGVHAVKQGLTLRDNLERALHHARTGRTPRPAALQSFRPYPAAPLILSTGVPEGLYVAGPLWLRGRPWLRLKHLIYRRWMRRYHDGRWQQTRSWQMLGAEAAYTNEHRSTSARTAAEHAAVS